LRYATVLPFERFQLLANGDVESINCVALSLSNLSETMANAAVAAGDYCDTLVAVHFCGEEDWSLPAVGMFSIV
jgi:hypothetical protein